MSTLQHIIDISGPMLGGFAAGQRQLALRQQAEQAAIDDAMRQQAFAAHIQQQGIQNQHWDQGFQLDQQQFQQRSAQDDIRNNQWQQGFGLDQQNAAMRSQEFEARRQADEYQRRQDELARGQQMADSTMNVGEWERYNPPPADGDLNRVQGWMEQRGQFSGASPTVQGGYLRQMEQRKKEQVERLRQQQANDQLLQAARQVDKDGLGHAVTGETRGRFEQAAQMGILANDAGVSMPSSIYSEQTHLPQTTPEEVAQLYQIPLPQAQAYAAAINRGDFGKTMPRSGLGGQPATTPVIGSMSISEVGRDGKIQNISAMRGQGRFPAPEQMDGFRQIAAALEKPIAEPWLGWNETQDAYDKRIEKRARQIAAKAGWNVNPPGVAGGVTPGGVMGESYAAPAGQDNIDEIINQLTPEQIQAILQGG